MFGIDATEFVLIIVLAIVLFGPERIPEFSRKAARLIVTLRGLANNAQTQLREELGPEFSDLNIYDLNPKTFVKKHLSEEIAAIEAAKSELNIVGGQIKEAATTLQSAAAEASSAIKDMPAAPPAGAKFDLEAT